MAFILLKKSFECGVRELKREEEREGERGKKRWEGEVKCHRLDRCQPSGLMQNPKNSSAGFHYLIGFAKKLHHHLFFLSKPKRERESELESTRRREKVIKDKTKKKMQEKLFSKRVNIDGLERKEKERKKERLK